MGELAIKHHDFENEKKKIKKFSEQTTTELDLKRVDDSKDVREFLGDCIFGRGIGLDHKVTGEELNQLITQVQTHFQGINSTQIKLIKEFGQVYSVFEALDKDYIPAILISIKATEETSQRIQETQGQIKEIVENQRKTLEELKKFKTKLDGYVHIGDIDKIWLDCQGWHREISSLSKFVDSAAESSKESAKKVDAVKVSLMATEEKISELSKESNILAQSLESIIAFTSAMEEISHLQDLDEMWDSLTQVHDSIQIISDELGLVKDMASKYKEDLDTHLTFMKQLSGLKHLLDVDAIWSRIEDYNLCLKGLGSTSEEHAGELNKLTKKNDSLLKSIDATKDDVKHLNEYKAKLSKLSHLDDIDGIWAVVEKQSAQLSALESQYVDITSAVQNNKESADMARVNAIQQFNATVKTLENKVKYAYLIAGGSAGLAIIELIVLLMKVI